MARFRRFRAPKITTVIGRETEVHGNVKFQGGLHVDGTIEGDVTGEQDPRCALILSETGAIKGDVRVSNVILNGSIVGDVYVSGRAELAPEARVSGTLYYRLLEMAIGAEVNGQLVHMEEEETRMLSYDGSEEEEGYEKALAAQDQEEQESEPETSQQDEADRESVR